MNDLSKTKTKKTKKQKKKKNWAQCDLSKWRHPFTKLHKLGAANTENEVIHYAMIY